MIRSTSRSLAALGAAQTVLQCCQRADEDKLRKALAERRRMAS